MALIKCKECGKEISNTIKKCPHCGYINKEVKKQNQEVIRSSSNISRTGAIMTIVGSSLLLGFLIIAIIASFVIPSPTTPKESVEKSNFSIDISIGEDVEVNQTLIKTYFYFVVAICIITIVLGIRFLKNKINKKYHTLYGITILIFSIIMSSLMLLMLNCCLIYLFIAPVLSFIGSIMILVGNVKEK